MKVNLLIKLLRRGFRDGAGQVAALFLGLILVLWPARALRSDNFVFYFTNERHVVRLETIDSANYLPVLETLNSVGKITGWDEKRNSLTVWFAGAQIQLKAGDKKVKIGKSARSLSRPVRVSNGQWMVPLDFVASVLGQVIPQRVVYQMGDKRAFIGDIKPLYFTTKLEPVANGARLTVQFSAPVAVRTASRNGKWVVFLGDAGIAAPERPVLFQNPYLSELQFDDEDGIPKLILTPGAEGLNFIPAQPPGGTILVAEVSKPAPKLTQLPPVAARPPAAVVPAPPVAPPLPVIVLDPGHGGQDLGARSRDGLAEKDVVAALGERVRQALLATNSYRVVVTRSGDTDPSFDERAAIANAARPAAFVTFHAGNLGSQVPRLAVYTYFSSSRPLESTGSSGGANRLRAAGDPSIFLSWAELQQAHLDRSRRLAHAIESQLATIPGVTAGDPVEAPVRALRNVDAPAAAVEIGSFSPEVDARPLTSAALQDQIAAAIVHAVQAFLGGQS